MNTADERPRVLCVDVTPAVLDAVGTTFDASDVTAASSADDALSDLDAGAADWLVVGPADVGVAPVVHRRWPSLPCLLALDDDGAVTFVRVDDLSNGDGVASDADDAERTELERCTETVRSLHETATSLGECRTTAGVYRTTVTAAASVLGFEDCLVAIVEDDVVVPVDVSSSLVDAGVRPVRLDGEAVRAVADGVPCVVADGVAADVVPAGAYRSGFTVPLGPDVILQAFSPDPDAFDEYDVRLAEILADHAAGALVRVRSQTSLERQNRRLDEFASVVAHDLRNPLAVIAGRLELAAATGDLDHLDHATAAVQRMERMLDELLRLARAGRDVGETAPVGLEAVARAAWAGVDHGDATLVVADGLGTVEADADRLQELFENLYRNAVEHGSTSNRFPTDDAVEHGSTSNRPHSDDPSPGLTVTVGPCEAGFYVADDGPGVPAASRDEVFDHGYTTSEDGTGFGLSIVARIADAHGWTASVTESETGGARFEFV